ncbi:Hsp70 family protein [Verrucomicrobia bacterium]|nr:Hsp70 family protein [Verrucomicrobiota bacterium]
MKPVGIDLGTTNSAIAILDEFGKGEIVPVDSDRVTPSIVSFPTDENIVSVGRQAKNDLISDPSSVVQHVKRDMGTNKTYSVREHEYNPQQISSFTLKRLYEYTKNEQGEIGPVVITVPAAFNEAQRQATMQAGELAGFNVGHIINEPTAAALAYASSGNSLSGKVMIYDMGGGTFDVTIAKIENKDVNCITSQGDLKLGGIDFDEAIYEIIRKQYRNEHKAELPDPDDENGKHFEFLIKAEELKISLSKREKAVTTIYGDSGPCRIEITRSEFEGAISTLIAKSEMLCETALDDAGIKPSEIDNVILVGGSTRIPAIRDSIKKLTGKDPLDNVNPDECVAIGAAIYSGLKSQDLTPAQKQAMSDIAIKDVCGHFYGTKYLNVDEKTEIQEMAVKTLIKKDTPIPVEVSETFYTVYEDQDSVHIEITQAQEDVSDPAFVMVVHEGTFELPKGRPAQQPIKVTYRYTGNATMEAEFLDVNSKRKYLATLDMESIGGSTAELSAGVNDFEIED